jgi:hypothetical protein
MEHKNTKSMVPGSRYDKELDCTTEDNRTPEEISECIARTRRDMQETLNVVEKKIDPSKLYDQTVGYVRQNYQSEWDWFSDLPRRMNENPGPFILIGAGMVIGGLGLTSYAMAKQRKSSAPYSESKGLVERGKQKWHELRSDSGTHERRRGVHLRAGQDTFDAGQSSDQASTEEIFFDQYSTSASSDSATPKDQTSMSKEENKVFINEDVDIRMGEEQFKEAKDFTKE